MKFLSELKLVYIKGDYFRYISSFDQNIYYDENNPNYPKKPHLGLLMENNGILYVIPLTSAKPNIYSGKIMEQIILRYMR